MENPLIHSSCSLSSVQQKGPASLVVDDRLTMRWAPRFEGQNDHGDHGSNEKPLRTWDLSFFWIQNMLETRSLVVFCREHN